MKHFVNIFNIIGTSININFQKLAEVRRAKMIQEGIEVNSINWELYVKVLEAKHQALLHS